MQSEARGNFSLDRPLNEMVRNLFSGMTITIHSGPGARFVPDLPTAPCLSCQLLIVNSYFYMPLSAINGAFKRALREHLIVNIKRAQEKEQLRGPKKERIELKRGDQRHHALQLQGLACFITCCCWLRLCIIIKFASVIIWKKMF